jgi:hypothetical protein
MRRYLWVGLLLAFLFPAATLEVERTELEPWIDADIEFRNYEGPHDDIQSREDIIGIGTALGAQFVAEPATFRYFDRYSVIHAVDPEDPEGLDADIFLILPAARVDHIDNVRRVVAAYLSAAYQYSDTDAALLSRYITIYNAVFRGTPEFFQERYKKIVMDNLTPEHVGLSTLYSDWPGGTEMVIPLGRGAAPGRLGAVTPTELLDPDVTERLREDPERELDTRRDMVDLVERTIDEETAAISERRQELESEKEEITRREREPESGPDRADREQTETDQTEQDDEREEITQRREALEREEAELERREQDLRDMTEAVTGERERIAEDIARVMDEEEEEEEEEEQEHEPETPPDDAISAETVRSPETGVYIIVDRQEDPRGRLVIINTETGEILQRSDVRTIRGRRLVVLGEHRVAVVEVSANEARLVEFHSDTLEETRSSRHVVAPQSFLSHQPEMSGIFAVVRIENSWRIGRFTESLELAAHSVESVHPGTAFLFTGESVVVQSDDDRVITLSLDDLQ